MARMEAMTASLDVQAQRSSSNPYTAAMDAANAPARHVDLSHEQLVQMYRLMCLSRRTDDREILLKRQQKIFFQISGAGHEALLVAAGMALKPGYDWFFPYYRDRALCLTLGSTVEELLLQAVGSSEDPSSGGRQMPNHWGNTRLNIVSASSVTATQCLHAIGCAEAGRYFARHPEAAEVPADARDYRAFKDVHFHGDEVVYLSIGEGSTSQGEFWESLNTASNQKLPVLYVVEDNGYAISTPVEVNTPGGSISRLVANFPNFYFAEVDGCDPVECYRVLGEAIAWCRSGQGPAFVHGHVVRPYSHALSDDERLYRSEQEIAADAERDPLPRFRRHLLREGVLDERALEGIEREVEEEVQAAAERALAAPIPAVSSILRHVYSEAWDPTAPALSSEPAKAGPEKSMADLINACLHDEMRRDPRIVVYGEDVADASREEPLQAGEIKGKGGVFKLTAGLQLGFGSDRCFNSPLAEANIVGRALGFGVRGIKPVVEIQFFDYIWPALHQMRNELSNLRWRSNGTFSAPCVIRCPIGGYLTGGSIYHSQSGESIFTHTPGIRVIMPSNALDANGLLRTAIRCDDPVLFLEHKRLYRENYGRAQYPGPEYMIPFGKASVVRTGTDVTVITYGAVVPRALQAAQRAQRDLDLDVELIDLRSLSPYDWDAIAASVKKTSRVLVAHEDMLSWGYGAEIAARIADELFDSLDAPVRRVGGMDTFVAYQPVLEDAILPQSERIFEAIAALARY